MSKILSRVNRSEKIEYFILSIIIIGAFFIRLYKIGNPVADWHSWRQADTASVTRSYLNRGLDLLRPRYHDISVIQTGYTNLEGYRFVEFPLFNFIHFCLFKAFPVIPLEVWGRLVSVGTALITSIVLFFIGKKAIGVWGGILASAFFAFLPFNIYFTRVILPDPLSVMLAVLSVWLFWEYIDREKSWLLVLSALSFSLALLTKPQALFYGVPILYLALRKYGIRGIFSHKLLLLSINIALAPFFLWRAWMNQTEFLQGIPYFEWIFNKIDGKPIRFRPAFWRWIFGERVGKLILGSWGLVPFSLGIIYKTKKNVVQMMLLSSLLYLSVIAAANIMHDYYQIFIIPPISLALSAGSIFLWRSIKVNRWLSRGLLIFCLGMMFGMGWYQIRGNYNINHPEIVEAGKRVDELLPKDALVVAPYNGDTAFLYQTARWGWPIVHPSIDNLIQNGADYYVSVNYNDNTNSLMARFETVEATPRYVILDLHKSI